MWGGPGSDRTRSGAEGVPETVMPTRQGLADLSSYACHTGWGGTRSWRWASAGWESSSGCWGSPRSPVSPPAPAPSSPAHSCPSCAPYATAGTCTSPGWRLGGGTPSRSAGGCPWMGWREEGDPRVKELKAPGLWARVLDRGRDSAGNMYNLGPVNAQRWPQCAHPSKGERRSCW